MNSHLVKMLFGIDCKGLFFSLKDFSNSSLSFHHMKKLWGTALSRNEFSNVSLNFLFIKNFWALIARIRSLPWVNYHMFLQISTIWESFGTTIALVWFLPWMDSQMFFKLWFSETALEHWLQGYGFSPQWILKWIAKLPSSILWKFIQRSWWTGCIGEFTDDGWSNPQS